ncbi:hypothetical protein N8E89_03185 [Phyllobacterium sp. A18/5-2]|uniref:hypothetical protein n=1 Tax=Phyllobacterium sp. A18/5-2 TaxID=2978392 RepID=UPI0021C965C0|nr:hypothetical protein [Phyllobacterium sp. A18/5-2]UXN64826.1 hypothetical protein N8E89_03185 [Phyllobacterium sp. A18/5-2]
MTDKDWQQRLDALWAEFDQHEPDDFVGKIESLTAGLPPGDAVALFERASAK